MLFLTVSLRDSSSNLLAMLQRLIISEISRTSFTLKIIKTLNYYCLNKWIETWYVSFRRKCNIYINNFLDENAATTAFGNT